MPQDQISQVTKAARLAVTPRQKPSSRDTRSAVLDYMTNHPPVTVAVLSGALGVSRADIRYHLKELREEGLVEILPRRADEVLSRGRPELTYRVAAFLTRNHLPGLCHALLAVYLGSGLPEQLAEIPDRLARIEALAAALTGEEQPVGNLTARLNKTVEWLNMRQYDARWEAGARGPRILLRRCPYAVLLAEHPALCEVDRLALERLVQLSLRQSIRQNPVTGRPRACVFEVVHEEFSNLKDHS